MAFASSAASVILATPSSESISTCHRAAGATSFMDSASGGMRGGVHCVIVGPVRVEAKAGPKSAYAMYDRELHNIGKIEESCPHLIVGSSARRPMRVVYGRLDFKEEYRMKCLLDNEDSGKIDGPAFRGPLELRGYHVMVGGWK